MSLVAAQARAEPLKIRLGWIGTPGSWGPAIAAKQDLAKHANQSYTLELLRLNGTSPMVTALAANELDIAPLSFSAFGLAVQNGGLDDLRVIADEIEDGKPGYYTTEFLVKKDGPETIADLKGKTLATNAIGGATDMAMRATLRKAGMEEKRDYTIVETQLGNMKAFLIEGKADLIAPSPNFVDAELRQISRPLFTQKDAFGITQFTAWYARTPFIAAHRGGLGRFPRGCGARGTLVARSGEPQGSGRAHGRDRQGPARAYRVGLYQRRLVPRPRRQAQSRRAPT